MLDIRMTSDMVSTDFRMLPQHSNPLQKLWVWITKNDPPLTGLRWIWVNRPASIAKCRVCSALPSLKNLGLFQTMKQPVEGTAWHPSLHTASQLFRAHEQQDTERLLMTNVEQHCQASEMIMSPWHQGLAELRKSPKMAWASSYGPTCKKQWTGGCTYSGPVV